jgi:hypothetical protein
MLDMDSVEEKSKKLRLGVTMGSKFYTIKFKDRIIFGLDSIFIYF